MGVYMYVCMYVSNKIITGDMLGSNTDFECVLHRKPDILIYDRQTMKAFTIEVSVPFDAFVDKCYHTKFNYYQPLNGLISLDMQDIGYNNRQSGMYSQKGHFRIETSGVFYEEM